MSEKSITLPVRNGERPETGPHIPHLQHTQKSPDHIREALRAWALKSLPNVREDDTRISVSTTRAFWLDESVAPANTDCFMPPPGGREFAHLHLDGSLHLCMSDAAVNELVERAWGEPHPLKDQGVNEVLLYALRAWA
jgi:phospholipase/carboxylesterase